MKKVFLFLFLTIVIVCSEHSLFAQVYTPSSALSYSGQSNIVIDGKSFTTGTSGASIYLTNCTNVVIKNCKFTLTASIIGVQLMGCTNVEITGCSFSNFNSGVYAVKCKGGINIHCNQFNTIAGTKPRGQMVQFNTCTGGGNRVSYNTLDTPVGIGGAEDLINMYASSGIPTDPIQINGNQLRGGGPATSGGGIMMGDNGSHDVTCDGNILVDPGQYGISAPSGSNMIIKNNKVYSAQYAWTNVGIYAGTQSEVNAGWVCDGPTIQVLNNQVQWTNKNGIKNGWYNCPCCPGVIQSGNNFNASITTSILPTTLQFNGSQCPVSAVTKTQTITLTKGWNLISINVCPSDSSITTMFKNVDVLEIKTETNFWRKGQNTALNSLSKLLPGAAYLVNMNIATNLTISGNPLGLANYASVSTGWNLIGCYDQTSVNITNYFSATNCKEIKNFNGFWIPNGSTNSITTIDPGKGYFIKK
jgi:hypothetical protein